MRLGPVNVVFTARATKSASNAYGASLSCCVISEAVYWIMVYMELIRTILLAMSLSR